MILGGLRQYLIQEATVKAANALVTSRLDCCISLFRRQKPNSLARFLTNTTIYSHITLSLKSLHWLLVHQYSGFKIATIVYKFPQSGNPKYFGAIFES